LRSIRIRNTGCSTVPHFCSEQDGEQTEVTKQYKVVYEDTEAFMKKLISRVRRRKKKDDADEDD